MNHQSYRNSAERQRQLQDLRQLAFEYVKQIVLKANELSEQQESRTNNNNPDRTTASRATNEAPGSRLLIDATNKWLVEEAAQQLNKRFRLATSDKNNPSSELQQQQDRSAKSVTYQTTSSNNPAASQRKSQVGTTTSGISSTPPAKPAKTTRHITSEQTKKATHSVDQKTTAMLQRRTSDYVEEDCATMSSSQDENESRARASLNGGNRSLDNNQQQGQHQRPKSAGGRLREGLQQCLNWHLLVSCFSTCLPEGFTGQATGRGDGAGMGPTAL